MIATITCSKRPDLFKRTVESFWSKCKDIGIITKVLLADDASSLADREAMLHTMKSVGGNTNGFVTSIRDEPVGHPVNLKSVIDHIQTDNPEPHVDFYLHLEDDFVMIAKGTPILAALDVLLCNPKIIQCCLGVERPVKWTKYRTRSGVQYTIRPPDISTDPENPYPSFTLNPSVMRISAMKDVGPFENVEHFEKVYGDKVNAKGYLVADLYPFWMRHCGDISAYDLNGTKR